METVGTVWARRPGFCWCHLSIFSKSPFPGMSHGIWLPSGRAIRPWEFQMAFPLRMSSSVRLQERTRQSGFLHIAQVAGPDWFELPALPGRFRCPPATAWVRVEIWDCIFVRILAKLDRSKVSFLTCVSGTEKVAGAGPDAGGGVGEVADRRNWAAS